MALGFSFELGVTWLQALLWVAGIILTFKILSDQERSIGAWALGALFFSPIAALCAVLTRPRAQAEKKS